MVPGHLDACARAYLDRARRTYEAIELAICRAGQHSAPIEFKWWLNGGAVGGWGSITMPLQGMVDGHDWLAFPWALAHESLRGFGYHHGHELDRLDREAMAEFARHRWRAELDPAFVALGW